ncbi:MAG: hypothetical protein K8I30_12105 [Anaerolineae bacterium]|nr:hypothetical protein [Anaerolineae bacterium]
MTRKMVPLVFLLFSISWGAVGAQDCPALVQNALTRAEKACALMRGNQACYGYQTLDAQLQEGLSPFAFNGVGDITPVDTIESLRMSALDPVNDEWGVALMRVRADISDEQPNENMTLLAFGEVSIEADTSDEHQPMQAFAFRTGDTASGCTDITENGLLIQTPEGVGRVTLWINDVRIRVGSTVLFQAQPGGDLIVSTFEGHAEVQALGGTQEAATGMQVRVPMDEDMHPSAPPTEPEAFDPEALGLGPLVTTLTAFTDGSVTNILTVEGEAVAADGASGGGTDRQGDCNREHGQGEAAGNCVGLDNPNAANGLDNPNANNGQGSGNAGGKGN